jgi:hypothetical protein
MRLLLLWLAMVAVTPVGAQSTDDEAWIERHMAGIRIVEAPEPIVQRKPVVETKIALGDLSKHIGDDVIFVLDTGRERRGTIQTVTASSITILTKLHGGQATLEVPRASIRSAIKR